MARTMRGCLSAWSQQEGAAEPQNNASVMQLEEQTDAKEGEAIVDYELDIDYEPEGAVPTDDAW